MSDKQKTIAIIGGGPAGLMAAEELSRLGFAVSVYDRKPSVGRKFLMAGRGGLNLTHSEEIGDFIGRYGERAQKLDQIIRDYTPDMLRSWCEGLGQSTFIGTSGRVFPEAFKASPLMRAWIARLDSQGVVFHLNQTWLGWDGEALVFETPSGQVSVQADATLLALGGASWPKLGSDGGWVDLLEGRGVRVAPLQPANCGFKVQWSDIFKERFAGEPLKSVVATIGEHQSTAEIMITQSGIEGGGIYALSNPIREGIHKDGKVIITIDLKPALSLAEIEKRLKKPRSNSSLSNHLRKSLGLSPLAVNLLMESAGVDGVRNAGYGELAKLVKNCSITLLEPFSLERAISSAGGVEFSEVNDALMLNVMAGVFVAGEMLDWDAPTGGYLLQACFATGMRAAKGIEQYLADL